MQSGSWMVLCFYLSMVQCKLLFHHKSTDPQIINEISYQQKQNDVKRLKIVFLCFKHLSGETFVAMRNLFQSSLFAARPGFLNSSLLLSTGYPLKKNKLGFSDVGYKRI